MSHPIPQYHRLFNPLLRALKALGGSGSVKEINDKVIGSLDLPNEALERLHNPDEGNETEIEYRLAWARTYLKKYGLIDNSSRGVWSLTTKAESVHEVNPDDVVKVARAHLKQDRPAGGTVSKQDNGPLGDAGPDEQPWRVELHRILTKELAPATFERLVQRLLRESGFIQVEVTGRVGDGGIDGKGIARIHGFMSFHVIFQCKRYQGVVSAGEIRDFRGAMVGRSDKGLFITTGSFTRDAIREASREGHPRSTSSMATCSRKSSRSFASGSRLRQSSKLRSNSNGLRRSDFLEYKSVGTRGASLAMQVSIIFARDEDGAWIAECPSIRGCVSQGATRDEAIENIRDAIKLCLEVRAERGMPLSIEIDDFDREVALVRQNPKLMEFLDRRSRPSTTFTVEQARELLEIDGTQGIDGGARA